MTIRNLIRVAAALLLTLPMATGATGATGADIVLVASYHQDDAFGRPQHDAVRSAIAQGGYGSLATRSYFLDTRVGSPESVTGTLQAIKDDLGATGPALVVTIDDPAFDLVYEMVLERGDTWLVFTGLNRSLEYYNARARFLSGRTPVANITGVFEHLFMREQFDLLEAFLGREVSKVAILHSTDAIGMIVQEQIVKELAGTPFEDRVVSFAAEDVPAMLQHARAIQDDPEFDAYIPVTMSVFDPTTGRRQTMETLAPLLTASIAKIDLSLSTAFTELGFFGGFSVDYTRMGFQAGIQAARLLAGHSIRDMSVEDARSAVVAVNRSRLRALGIRPGPEVLGLVDVWVE